MFLNCYTNASNLSNNINYLGTGQEQTCTPTDQVSLLFCVLVFSVVLQGDVRGPQGGRRALPVAVAVLRGPQVAQGGGSGAVHAGRAVQVGHLRREEGQVAVTLVK